VAAVQHTFTHEQHTEYKDGTVYAVNDDKRVSHILTLMQWFVYYVTALTTSRQIL
jgi:hypothetical protein